MGKLRQSCCVRFGFGFVTRPREPAACALVSSAGLVVLVSDASGPVAAVWTASVGRSPAPAACDGCRCRDVISNRRYGPPCLPWAT
jgi:hypothetical protein